MLSATGEPVARAVVVLTTVGTASRSELQAGPQGRFRFARLTPGSYELRIEALGYRPLVARTLRLGAGDREELTLTLGPAVPPVTAIDTVAIAGSSVSRLRDGTARFGPVEIGLPDRLEGIRSVVGLAPGFDGSLGARGLPGSMTQVVADGVPVYRAPHPTALYESAPNPLFPRASLSGVRAIDNTADVEWGGSAGGWVALATRTSFPDGGFELDGTYSGDPTWSSGQLDIDTPSLLSWQAGLRGAIPVESDRVSLVVSAEALSVETPLAPRIPESVATELAGLDTEVLGPLTVPAVEGYRRFTGLARLDMQQGRTGHAFVRGAVGVVRRDFDDGAPLGTTAGLGQPEESIDFSIAGGLVGEYSPRVTLELLGGVSGSSRDFLRGSDRAPAYLVDSGLRLGDPPGVEASSSRTDLVLIPLARYAVDAGSVEIGTPVRLTSHSMTHTPGMPGDFVFADPAALLAGRGYGAVATTEEASFSTREVGVFAQYDGMLTSSVRLVLGARYDYEALPTDAVESSSDWLEASGLDNADYPSSLQQLGGGATIEITPAGSPGTRLFVTGSVHHGDLAPTVLAQAAGEDSEAMSTRYSGTGISWPEGELPATGNTLPTLTLLGPDTRAPRSANLTIGLTQRVVEGLTLHARGMMRRTDFLVRRRNLNVPITAQALDAGGRAVYGTLQKDGGLITAVGADVRRFSDFGEIWALDPDGWSELRGLSVGFEYLGSSLDLYLTYLRSETTDNWVGAGSGLRQRMLSPGVPDDPDAGDWTEGISDFDVPHRLSVAATARAGRLSVGGRYRLESGLPFTPGYRLGVDANGDGSGANDVAFVPEDTQLGQLLEAWPCLEDQAGSFAVRNSCRAEARHGLDVRVTVVLTSFAGRNASLMLDGLNLLESREGIIDDALLLVEPDMSITTSPDGSTITLPVSVNPGFGETLYPTGPGRLFRIGLRIGA